MFNLFKKKFRDETTEDQRKDLEKYPPELIKICLSGLDCDKLPKATGEFGKCLSNPIPANGPTGSMKYVNRLRSPDGGLIFHRLGSYDEASSGNVVDIYETVSIGGKIWDILYLDMYHPRRSTIVPSGYGFSKWHDILCRFDIGYSTNNFDPDFPFGLSKFIEKGLGGKSVARRYEDLVKDRSKFVRPPEHVKKLEKLKLSNRQSDEKIKPLQVAVYLGYIGETDYMERSAVIKLPQLNQPVIIFSPELSIIDGGKIFYSKDKPEDLGKDGFNTHLPNSPARDLKSGDGVIICFSAGVGDIINDDVLKVKYANFDEQSSHSFSGELEYNPVKLKDADLLPYKKLLVKGPVVRDEYGNHFIDGNIPVILNESLIKQGTVKVGDWVETKFIQVSFVKKIVKN